MDIGYRIKAHRELLGLTQEELAVKIGVSNKAISKWETGAGLPDITQVLPLTKVLGISTDELFKPRQPENSMKDFGGKLYELRRKANISREELEKKLNNQLVRDGLGHEMLPRMVEYWETGKIIPNIRVLISILPILTKLFNVSENEIVSMEVLAAFKNLREKEDDDDEEFLEVSKILREAFHPDKKDDFRCELLEDGLKQYPKNESIMLCLLEIKTHLAARYYRERDDRAKELYNESESLFKRAEDILSDRVAEVGPGLARRLLANMYVDFGEYAKAQALISRPLYADYDDSDEITCRILMHKGLLPEEFMTRKIVIQKNIGNLCLALQDFVEAHCRTGQPETAKALLKLILQSSLILSGGEIQSMADYNIDWVRLVSPSIERNNIDLALDLLEILIEHEINRPRKTEKMIFSRPYTNTESIRLESDVKSFVNFKLSHKDFDNIRNEPRLIKLLERAYTLQ